MEYEVSVIVSCFNEAANIEACVRSIYNAMPQAEIVVVHGGNDATYDIAQKLKQEIPTIVPVKNTDDRGKGHGIRTGITAANGKYMAQFDADLQFFAADLPAMIDLLRTNQADLVIGSRFMTSSDRSDYKPMFFRDFGNRVMGWYISALVGQRISDVTTGMKAWTREAIRTIDFKDDRYSYEAEIIVRAGVLKQRIKEIPVRYASRSGGASMHATDWAVVKAGLVIMMKSLACRLRGQS